jgi:hypothetical protein
VQPTKIKLDDVALLGELLSLVGEELWVRTPYEGLAGGSGFVAHLERVEPVNWSMRELLLGFDEAGASVNLACPRMVAWRVMNPLNETYWLEFAIRDRRVVLMQRIPSLRWCER